jgi:hypothetical protein
MKAALLIVTLFTTIANSIAATIAVPATANIFGAGHATPPAPAGNGGGVLPPVLAVTAGQSVSFTTMTGTVTHSNGTFSAAIAPFGPEGYAASNTSLGSLGGISSISGDGFFWLAGVFLDATEPSDPAPSGLPSFTTAAKQFTSLSPGLRQIFFIGDGQQASTPQDFVAPAGATRLFLGFVDEHGGQVGYYGDNVGSLTVTHNVPEPSSAVLLLSGALLSLRRRTLRTHERIT